MSLQERVDGLKHKITGRVGEDLTNDSLKGNIDLVQSAVGSGGTVLEGMATQVNLIQASSIDGTSYVTTHTLAEGVSALQDALGNSGDLVTRVSNISSTLGGAGADLSAQAKSLQSSVNGVAGLTGTSYATVRTPASSPGAPTVNLAVDD